MHVLIQGQLPAGCKLALSHRLSAAGCWWTHNALHPRRTWPSITLCLEADGFCIAELMDCLSPLGNPHPSALKRSLGWGWLCGRLVMLERGFPGYPISGLSPGLAVHPSYSRGYQHCTLTPEPDPGLPDSWERLMFPSQNGHFLVFAAERGFHFGSPLLLCSSQLCLRPFSLKPITHRSITASGVSQDNPPDAEKISWKRI